MRGSLTHRFLRTSRTTAVVDSGAATAAAGAGKDKARARQRVLRDRFGLLPTRSGDAFILAPRSVDVSTLSLTESGGWGVPAGEFGRLYREVQRQLPDRYRKASYAWEDVPNFFGHSSLGPPPASPRDYSVEGPGVVGTVRGDAPHADTLASRWREWRKLDPQLADLVRDGLLPEQDTPTVPIYLRNLVRGEHEERVVDAWVQSQRQTGSLVPYDLDAYGFPQTVVRIMLAKNDRVVLDYTPLNATMRAKPFSLPLVSDSFVDFDEDKKLWKADLKSGYTHLRHHRKAAGLACIVWKGVAYELVSVQLGMTQVPRQFQRLTSCAASFLSSGQSTTWVYLDDFFGWVSPKDSWEKQARKLGMENPDTASPVDILQHLGFTLGKSKLEWPPKEMLEILGFSLRAGEGSVGVPDDKHDQLVAAVAEMVDSDEVHVRDLACLAGRIMSLRLVWPSAALVANLVLAPVYEHVGADWQTEDDLLADLDLLWDRQVPCPKHEVEETREWLAFWQRIGPAPFVEQAEVAIESDASSYGKGWIWSAPQGWGEDAVGGGGQHINLEELDAFRLAVQQVPTQDRPMGVALAIDNTVAAYWLAKGSAKRAARSPLLKVLQTLRTKNLFVKHITWIPSEENVVADALSRQVWRQDHWQQWADSTTPKITVDAFASRGDARTTRFCSRQQAADSAWGTDFFAQNLTQEVLWVNPPWAVLSRAVDSIRKRGLTAYVLLPAREDFQVARALWDKSTWRWSRSDIPTLPRCYKGIVLFQDGFLT